MADVYENLNNGVWLCYTHPTRELGDIVRYVADKGGWSTSHIHRWSGGAFATIGDDDAALMFLHGRLGNTVAMAGFSPYGVQLLNRSYQEVYTCMDASRMMGLMLAPIERGVLSDDWDGSDVLDVVRASDVVPVWEVKGLSGTT